MSSITIGKKKYSTETIVRAFEYFAISRSLYERLREDYELPSISLLTKLTSKLDSAMDDIEFLNSVFSKLENEMQKKCMLLIKEVYVKSSLTYHAGSVFGKAVNKPDSLATTVLSFMLVSLYGGPQYLCRILPVCELDSKFLFEQTQFVLEGIKSAGEIPVALICDNQVNQALFKKFDYVDPWLTKGNMFLVYDFVHLLKSVRNNWITEKSQKLHYEYDGKTKYACWSSILRQKVSTCI